MNAINRHRTARKQHVCDTRVAHYPAPCLRLIEPGDRYVISALPPHVDPNASGSWWTMKLCRECAMHYGMDLDCKPLEDDPHGDVA